MVVEKPTVLILSFTPTDRDPRVQKQIEAFRDRYDITTAGFGPGNPGVKHVSLDHAAPPFYREKLGSTLKLFRLHRAFANLDPSINAARKVLGDSTWDAVVVNDIEPVPFAFELEPRSGVLSDLHEYYPRLGDDNRLWRILTAPYYRWIMREHVAKAKATTTVSPTFVEKYAQEYGIDPGLVVNASPYQDLTPTPVHEPIRLVHSGMGSSGRQIEVMVDAVRGSDANVTLDLLLVGLTDQYRAQLLHAIGDDRRVNILPPVPYDELIKTLNQYDVGVHLLHPTNFNHKWTIPNKIYDYVQARLGVVTGPTHEMAKIVKQYDLGVVTKGFEAADLTAAIDSLDAATVSEWKLNANRNARALSSDKPIEVWRQKLAEVFTD